MSTFYSGYDYDPSECEDEVIIPPNRNCFRAFINAPHTSSHHQQYPNFNAKSNTSVSLGGTNNRSSNTKDDKESNSYYGLLHHEGPLPLFEESFISESSPTYYSKNNNNYYGGGGKQKTKGGDVKQHHIGTSVICRINHDRHKSGGSIIGGGGRERDSNDTKSIVSRHSHAGLLDYDGPSVSGAGDVVIMNSLDKKDALTWKSSKTISSSSVASSSHRSRMSASRKSASNGEFPSIYDSFDFMEVDDIQRKSLGKSLISCVGLKKITRNSVGYSTSHHSSKDAHTKVLSQNHDNDMIIEETLPPAVPGSPQFFKFHNALPSHTVQNKDFPQIIFADNTEDNNNNSNRDHNAQGDDDDDFDNYFNNRMLHHKQKFGGDFTTVDINVHSSPSGNIVGCISSFGGSPSRSPSPLMHSNRQNSSEFLNASPTRSKSSRSRSRTGSRNPSPKSIRSYKEEEQFLDHLVNTVTAYNSYQKETKQQPSGRMVLNQLMDEIQTSYIPESVEVDLEEYSEDEVSEIGMASTSGGRKESDDKYEGIPTQKVYQQERRRKNPNDYRYNGENVSNQLDNVDERSLKWRLREADKQNTNNLLQNNMNHCVTREFLETKDSLMDLHNSGSTNDGNSGEKSGHADDEVDPTFAFGGTGVRKPPLALSEAFEDFGIDDRMYVNDQRPGDTFCEDDAHDPEAENVIPLSSMQQSSKHYSQPVDKSPRKADEQRRKTLMNTYIANHHNNNNNLSSMSSKKALRLRSSKYREINGNAYFSGTDSKVSNTTDVHQKKISSGIKHSPQSIAEFEMGL